MSIILKAGLIAVSAAAMLAGGPASAHEYYPESGYSNGYYGNQGYNNGSYYQQRVHRSYRHYQPRYSYSQSYYGNGYDRYGRGDNEGRGRGHDRGEHRGWSNHHDEGDRD
jgi:hypothetical protein